jgi:uncharacterized protein YjiS (DUF1127 family)
MPIRLSSLMSRERPAATRGEMQSLSDFNNHLLRDIGLRPSDLYAASVERKLPACCPTAAHRWANLMRRLHKILAPEPVVCCRS